MGKYQVQSRGAGDNRGGEFAVGRLLSTAALVGMDILTAPETTILKRGRYVVADTLNTRSQATAADRFQVGNVGNDNGNFLLPGVSGQGSAPYRFGGVITDLNGVAIGGQCRIQVAGPAMILVSNTVAVGDWIIICDGPSAARNARGTAFGVTPNSTTGVVTAPTAGATVGTTASNTYPIIGEVIGPLPGSNGTVAAPQLVQVMLYGDPNLGRLITSS